MTDIVLRLEDRRLKAGLTQRAVADTLGVSQPHYSKVVGGIVALTPELAARMVLWVEQEPAAAVAAASHGERETRIMQITRAIERQLRELNGLLTSAGMGPGRRASRRTRMRSGQGG